MSEPEPRFERRRKAANQLDFVLYLAERPTEKFRFTQKVPLLLASPQNVLFVIAYGPVHAAFKGERNDTRARHGARCEASDWWSRRA